MSDCVFCKIISGEIPAEKVFEDEEVVAFKDNQPAAPIHILVVPRKHISSLLDAQPSDLQILGKIQLVIKDLVLKLKAESGYKIAVNGGKFQEVPHLHYHLLGGLRRE
jgi:histidine triad (HIT) family protein